MLNQVILQGRLTADPELKHTQSGVAVLSFRIACDRDYRSKDAGAVSADFINLVAWRSTAEFISRYFGKGKMILVDGRLQMRDYTDRDGNRRIAAEVVVEQVHFCGGKRQEGPAESAPVEGQSRREARQPREPGAVQQAMGGYREESYEPSTFAPGYQELTEYDGELPF